MPIMSPQQEEGHRMGGKGTFSKHIIPSLLLILLFYPEPLILQAAMVYLLVVNFFFNFERILNLEKSQKEYRKFSSTVSPIMKSYVTTGHLSKLRH